ncbi:hypothetical protein [Helicobacter vulpis]|uniref:hypothetical protein n=1 Tax=Helicobacter vulpis TaxID=2316076 RepID=UPI000EAB7646|nr:hypothetical protein [Helicobacter vulpis]
MYETLKQVLLAVSAVSALGVSSLSAEEIVIEDRGAKGREYGAYIGSGVGGSLGIITANPWVGLGGSMGGSFLGAEIGDRVEDFFSPPEPQRPEPRPVTGPEPAWGWDFNGFDRPIP